MLGAIIILFVLPYVDNSPIRGAAYRPLFRAFFWLFVADFLMLTFLGAQHATETYVLLSRICSIYYFGYFLIIIPAIAYIENYICA